MQVVLWLIINASLILGTQAYKCKQKKRPHIIFILADDLGWNDASFHGSLQTPTPNIDALAANSVVLNNYYVQPLCTPSRAALMTGKHPITYGLQYFVLQSASPSGLSLTEKLLPQYLKDLDYETHALGKWHLGFYRANYTPTYRGFDSHLGYWTGKMDYWNHTSYDAYPNTSLPYGWGRVLRKNMNYADELNGIYSMDIFTQEAENLILNHKSSKPMFLYAAFPAVHSANNFELYQAPSEYIQQFTYIKDEKRRIFAAMDKILDESVGRILVALKNNSMLDNTIVVFSTDNGGEGANFRGGVGSNWPLRGNKGTTWEGGVRGVAFLWSKLIKKSPRISEQLMSIMDWVPTLYRAAGGNPDDIGKIYGINLWDALVNDRPSPRKELLHNIDPVENVQTLRYKKYKLTRGSYLNGEYDEWYGPSGRDNGISKAQYRKELKNCLVAKVLKGSARKVTDNWLSKFNVHCKYSNKTDLPKCNPTVASCLFNVIDDPCEQNNIADQYPEIVKIMEERIKQLNASSVPIVSLYVDPRSDPTHFDDHWTNWADFI